VQIQSLPGKKTPINIVIEDRRFTANMDEISRI